MYPNFFNIQKTVIVALVICYEDTSKDYDGPKPFNNLSFNKCVVKIYVFSFQCSQAE